MMDGEVSTEHVRYTLALVEESLIDACIEAFVSEDVGKIQELIATLKEKHIEARSFLEQVLYRVRDFMVENIQNQQFYTYSEILELLESAYTKVRLIPDGAMLIEITLLRIVRRHGRQEVQKNREIHTPVPAATIAPPKEKEVPKEKTTIPVSSTPKEIPEVREKMESQKPLSEKAPPKSEESPFSYPALITHLKESQPALTIDLKTARFQKEGTNLTLIFTKKWNFDRVNTSKTKTLIAEAMKELYKTDWTITCEFSE